MKGRKKIPLHVKVLTGRKIDPRDRNEAIVTHPLSRPMPPAQLSAEGLDCWNRLTILLEQAGILTQISRDKLARYCQAWSDWSEITVTNASRKRRFVIRNDRDYRQKKYEAKICQDAESVMRDFEKEYGMTPCSAARIRLPNKSDSPAEKMDDFIKGKGKPVDV